jgi:transcriptional regulator with XRE-family HTH domain
MPAHFGDQLKAYRHRARKTQRQLAADANLDFTYISKLETAAVLPPRDTAEVLAKALKLSPEEREDFLALAGAISRDMERYVRDQPAARELYRSVSQLPPEQQERRLREFIAQVERDLKRGGKTE